MNVAELFDSSFCLHLTLTLAHFLWQGFLIAAAAAIACRWLHLASPLQWAARTGSARHHGQR